MAGGHHDTRIDVIGGGLLGLAAVLAIIVANSPLAGWYEALFSTRLNLTLQPAGAAAFGIEKPLVLWINDGLMAVFFMAVGLEIKREFLQGALSGWKRAALPAFGAAGGVILPALIFLAIAQADPGALRGWAIPMATDIAFVVAIAAALGPAVPPALKAFLLALAIIDDLIAIIVIAVFYTAQLSTSALTLGLVGVAVLFGMSAMRVRRLLPYILVGIFTWVCVLKSGVHATLAGVALGLAIPLRRDTEELSLLERTEISVKPWIVFGILPLFAFANAGVSFEGMSVATLFAPMPLGIAVGLFVGKQLGVFGFAMAAVRLGLADMPERTSTMTLYGAAILTGIGFTMSLFIGSLAFSDPARAAEVRLGVIVGSLLSIAAGIAVLVAARRRSEAGAVARA